MTLSETQLKSFWRKVDRKDSDSCWPWLGWKINSDGYGAIQLNNKVYVASRISWVIANGPIEDNLCVLHSCDNPICVNPKHLFLGTRTENNKDRKQKSRSKGGSKKELICSRGHDNWTSNGKGRKCKTCSNLATKQRYWRAKRGLSGKVA